MSVRIGPTIPSMTQNGIMLTSSVQLGTTTVVSQSRNVVHGSGAGTTRIVAEPRPW